MQCIGCGYQAKDEADLADHLLSCKSKPASKWLSYAVYGTQPKEYRNSEILEDKK